MSIAMRCPTCGTDYQLADKQAGRRVRCRQCKDEFDVPSRVEVHDAVSSQPPPRRKAVPDEIEPPAPSVARPSSGNKALVYVLSAVGACLVLALLVCAGVGYLLTR